MQPVLPCWYQTEARGWYWALSNGFSSVQRSLWSLLLSSVCLSGRDQDNNIWVSCFVMLWGKSGAAERQLGRYLEVGRQRSERRMERFNRQGGRMRAGGLRVSRSLLLKLRASGHYDSILRWDCNGQKNHLFTASQIFYFVDINIKCFHTGSIFHFSNMLAS